MNLMIDNGQQVDTGVQIVDYAYSLKPLNLALSCAQPLQLKPMLSIKPSTKNDFINLYGMPLNNTFQAFTAFNDKKPIGAAGVMYNKNSTIYAFGHVTPELRKYKVTLYKLAMKALEIIKKQNGPVYAIADKNIPKSEDLLMKMGFIYRAPTNRGALYEWIG